MTLPVLLSPADKSPTVTQLAFVEHGTLWWPAIVYNDPGQALEQRNLSSETKTYLAVQIFEAFQNDRSPGQVCRLLGFQDNWMPVTSQRDIYIFLSHAVSQTIPSHLQIEWKEAIRQAKHIMIGDVDDHVLPSANLFQEQPTDEMRHAEQPQLERNLAMKPSESAESSLLSNKGKRKYDDNRIWGREHPRPPPPSRKRIQTTKIVNKRKAKLSDKSHVSYTSNTALVKVSRKPSKHTLATKKPTQKQRSKRRQNSTSSRENFYIWTILWQNLQADGWLVKRARNPLHDWYYFPPNIDAKHGTLGKDYFATTQEVIEWAKTNNYRDKIGAKTSSSEEEEDDGDNNNNNETDGETLNSADDEVSYATDEDTYNSTDDERSRNTFKWGVVWPALRKQGWTLVKDGNERWCFARSRDLDFQSATLGQDYFHSSKDLLEYVNDTDYLTHFDDASLQVQEDDPVELTPPNCRTKPQDPAKPIIYDSEEEDDSCRFEWKYLWRKLSNFGWSHCKAGKYNKLHSHYYIRPGRTVEDGTLGVDYFLSAEDVIRYEKVQEGLLDDNDNITTSLTQERATKARRITLSPRSAILAEKVDKKVYTKWWQLQGIPSFVSGENIWKILKEKLHFRFCSGTYSLPKDAIETAKRIKQPYSFAVDHDLRAFLCRHGIPNYDESIFSEEERTNLLRWVTFANVPVNPSTSIRRLKELVILDQENAMQLLEQISFQDLGAGRYYHVPTCTTFDSFETMRSFVRGMDELMVTDGVDGGRGRGRKRNSMPLDDVKVLQLRFWAALSSQPLPVFGKHN